MISFDNNKGSKEFASLPPLNSLRSPTPPHRPLTEVFNFSDGDIPGDVFFSGNGPNEPNEPNETTLDVGIEIKSLHDLVGSLDTGRLQGQGINSSHGQLLRMLDYFDITILIYYGSFWPSYDNHLHLKYSTTTGDELVERITKRYSHRSNRLHFTTWLRTLLKYLTLGGSRRYYWHGLQNALFEIQLLGVNVIRVNNKREVALIISSLYHLLQKNWSQHKLFRSFNVSNPSTSRIARIDNTPTHIIRCAKTISASCDSIGYERGLAIAHHFHGNIPLMISSISTNPRALECIRVGKNKIGPVISESAHRDIGTHKLDINAVTNMLR